MNHPHVFPVLQRLIEKILISMDLPEKRYMELQIRHHISNSHGKTLVIKIDGDWMVKVEYREVDEYTYKEELYWLWHKGGHGEYESENTAEIEARLNELVSTVFLTKKGTLSLKNRTRVIYDCWADA